MDNRPLRRTVWEDRRAIFEHVTLQTINTNDHPAGKWLITRPRTRPNYVLWITYSDTDILRAQGTIVLCCPADLLSYSATTRYVIREYGQENIFRLRPSVGTALRLAHSPTDPWDNQIFLLCTRASNKHPLLHDILHACLTHLLHQLHQHNIMQLHLPIHDPERSINLLSNWYAMLRDHFTNHDIDIILHDRVMSALHQHFPKMNRPEAHLSSLHFHDAYYFLKTRRTPPLINNLELF